MPSSEVAQLVFIIIGGLTVLGGFIAGIVWLVVNARDKSIQNELCSIRLAGEQHKSTTDETITDLKNQIDFHRQLANTLQSQIIELEKSHNLLRAEKGQLETKLILIEAENTRLREKVDDQEKRIQAQDQIIGDQAKQIADLKNENKDLRHQLDQVKAKTGELQGGC